MKAQFKDGTGGAGTVKVVSSHKIKAAFLNVMSIITATFANLMSEFLAAMGTHVFDNKLKPVITRAMNDYMKVKLILRIIYLCYAKWLGPFTGMVKRCLWQCHY